MTARISLALILHNHQPVGNFGWIIGEVYERAYEPMVGALERHPGVRLAVHYTAPLLEWLDVNQPEFIDRLRALVDRGQIEIVGGGHFEPILASLPDRDRVGQLVRMRADLERRFGVAPAGAWLAERVWEPSLPTSLVDAGYAYTVLDDNHLRGASVPEDEMWGTYTTDDQGRLLTIFGTEKGLRYRIPWQPVPELISYLKAAATESGDRVGIMGDDGEKFGGWPGTAELSWGNERWVDKCFSALEENSDWLTTVTPSDWMRSHPPIGRIYIPTASYVEMTEWVLPVDEAPTFSKLLHDAVQDGSPAARFLHGGMWRNFAARYREVNDLHKQMLRVSTAVDSMALGPDRDRAIDHLYRGQSNDCYWHGLFGGIYLVHMRMATLAELIAAEDLVLADSAADGLADYDLDGRNEVLIGTVGQTVLIDPAEGGGISSWDLRASRVALASVMRRRPEAYHAKLREAEAAAATEAAASKKGNTKKDAVSPHESFAAKEAGLSKLLVYDDHDRRSALVRILDSNGAEMGDFVNGEWMSRGSKPGWIELGRQADGLEVTKAVLVDGGRASGSLQVVVVVSATADFAGALEVEWNLNLLGGGTNPEAYYAWADQEMPHDSPGSVAAGVHLSFGNRYEGVAISVAPQPAAAQQWFPVETVSNSEAGFERVYQGSCLTQRWPLKLRAGQSATCSTTFRFEQTRDRAAEERANA
ncbi:MAG TPA: alpha-amylase/4-alpha-glucanotransferase domain-containing protein [Candidatus Limnocylindria bacterium]|nr:alpha-amylase/4-alpha-glucanotransferase domain-containing protein [Candidatus Limnocylindria bacterium]